LLADEVCINDYCYYNYNMYARIFIYYNRLTIVRMAFSNYKDTKKYQYARKNVTLHRFSNIRNMTALDIILAIPLAFFIWKGFRKGAIYEIATLLGLSVGIYLGYHLCHSVMMMLGLTGDTAILIAFFVVFLAVVVLAFLLGKVVEGVVKLIKVGFLNNLLGALFSLMVCVSMLSVLLYYVTIIDSHEVLITAQAKSESLLYKPVTKTGDKLIGNLKSYVDNHRAAAAEEDPDLPLSFK